MSDDTEADDTVEIPMLRAQVLAGIEAGTPEPEPAHDDCYSLTEPERIWLEWFYSLSQEDQRIVERCGENDISVDADNFQQMKKRLLAEP